MHLPQSIHDWIEGPDKDLRLALAGFDEYCQQLIMAVDQYWNSSKRMQSMEYCLFLYGAALAISRGYGREDSHSVALLGPYLSAFMDWKVSVRWILECETALSKSRRLQGVQAAGGNTAQAVWLAASRGCSEDLSSPKNMHLSLQIFSEVRKLMDEQSASDEPLFAASGLLYDSVVGNEST